MQPGRELDVLVARHVFGGPEGRPDWWMWRKSTPHWGGPDFSTDIAAAWQVVLMLTREDGPHNLILRLEVLAPDACVARFQRSREQTVGEAGTGAMLTAPHAICLAALRAVGAVGPA